MAFDTRTTRVFGQIGLKEFQDLFDFVENDCNQKQLKKDFKNITDNVDLSLNGSTYSVFASIDNTGEPAMRSFKESQQVDSVQR